jgi:hypothetical protein
MSPLLFRIERKARFAMGALAGLVLVLLLLFKAELIQLQPSFDAYGWYTVSTVNPGMKVTDRVDSEADCRAKSRLPAVTCLQGKSLNTELFASARMH